MKTTSKHWLFIIAMTGILIGSNQSNAQDKPDYTSKIPQYHFSDKLSKQEKELKTNPLLLRFNESREKLSGDPYRPVYHYVNPEGNLNDPNGLCFWQGKWHLFYQSYPPEDTRQHWGHAVSDDMLHWRDLPLAIYPNPEMKVYSGSAFVEDDRVIAMYQGVGQGVMMAVSSDPLLLNWEKSTDNPVIPLAKEGEKLPYHIGDPFIWKKEDYYYAVTGGTRLKKNGNSTRAEYLHRSKDLAHWEYMHPFLENDLYGESHDGSCPYFWPIGDKHIMMHFSHKAGGKYMIGDYDKERDKFIVGKSGNFNFGAVSPGGVHAPSAFPDGKGGVVAIFNMNVAKPTKGWDHIMTLPRQLNLDKKGELVQKPYESLKSLHKWNERQTVKPMQLPANQEVVFENVHGNAMEVQAVIEVSGSSMIEMKVLRSHDSEEYTRIAFFANRGINGQSIITLDNSHSSILHDVTCRPPESAPVNIGSEPLKLRVFIDKSIVEVFVNDKQVVALRVYPGRNDSVGVSLQSRGKKAYLRSMVAYPMRSIYVNK